MSPHTDTTDTTDTFSDNPSPHRRRRPIAAGPFALAVATALLLTACNGFGFGNNGQGRLGDGTFIDRSTPKRHAVDLDFLHVSAGDQHSCGVTEVDRDLYCWGDNSADQLGLGPDAPFEVLEPTLVDDSGEWDQVAAGGSHTCALRTSGELYCWGNNRERQSTFGLSADQTDRPTLVSSRAHSTVTAGKLHTCALELNGDAFCWGFNADGRLGMGFPTPTAGRTLVAGGHTWRDIDAGNHTCAITTGQALFCWGPNSNGQLGIGDQSDRAEPVRVGTFEDWLTVGAGERHSCATRSRSIAFCWGSNQFGQLGDGGTGDRSTPAAVDFGNTSLSRLTVGGFHSCAVAPASQAVCWGNNERGQIGDGSTINRRTPTPVAIDRPVRELDAGRLHTQLLEVQDTDQ